MSADTTSPSPLPTATFHILVALVGEDLHGYAILRDIEQRSAGGVRLGAGTLYRTLQRLLEQGWIVELDERPAQDDERRRYYRITPLGRRVVEAEARRLTEMLDYARARGLAPEAS
jgi:DNA-binding PadR family transcriptional regulator